MFRLRPIRFSQGFVSMGVSCRAGYPLSWTCPLKIGSVPACVNPTCDSFIVYLICVLTGIHSLQLSQTFILQLMPCYCMCIYTMMHTINHCSIRMQKCLIAIRFNVHTGKHLRHEFFQQFFTNSLHVSIYVQCFISQCLSQLNCVLYCICLYLMAARVPPN